MKLSEIADELAKLNEPEQESDEAEIAEVGVELEKLLMENPQITDEMALLAMREMEEAEKIDPLTAHARAECRKLGIGDFGRPPGKPVAIPENASDPDEAWLRQVLERRRAMPQPPRPQQPQQQSSWIHPRRYSALSDGEWYLGGGGYW
jgi:hypothetical protein